MLMGVGLSMAKGGAIIPYPETLPNLQAWFRYNVNLTDSLGNTTEGDSFINDGAQVTRWRSYAGSELLQLGNGQQADAPLYEADDNTLEFSANSRYLNLETSTNSSDVELTYEIEFTFIIRLRFTTTTNDCMFGHDSTDFFRLTNNRSFRSKIGSTHQNNFVESSDEIDSGVGAPYYCIAFTRNKSYGTQVIVDGGTYIYKEWGGPIAKIDTDLCTLSNIGSQADNVQSLGANVKDVLLYDKHLNETELADMFLYLHSQG